MKKPVLLIAYGVGFFVLALFSARWCAALMPVLVLTEFFLIAAVAVGFACVADTSGGVWRCVWAWARQMADFIAVSLVVILISSLIWHARPLAGAVVAQVSIAALALVLASAVILLRSFGIEPFLAQFVSVCIAVTMLGTLFYADPIVERWQTAPIRQTAITGVLFINPLMGVSWPLLNYDWLRQEVMYDDISVIGRWYQFGYPSFWQQSAGYAAASCAGLAGAAMVVRYRRLRGRGGK